MAGSGRTTPLAAAPSSAPAVAASVPSVIEHVLREQLGEHQLLLRREQTEAKLLRSQLKTLERQLAELHAWQGNQNAFECDVAAAIQLAQRADDSRDGEIARLRHEIDELKVTYEVETRAEAPKDERKRLQQEVAKLELHLRSCQLELDRSKKDLFAERVKVKRSSRDVETMRAQLRSAREEMGRLYDDLARARHEISRLTVVVAGVAGVAVQAPSPAPPPLAPAPSHPLDRLQDFLSSCSEASYANGGGGTSCGGSTCVALSSTTAVSSVLGLAPATACNGSSLSSSSGGYDTRHGLSRHGSCSLAPDSRSLQHPPRSRLPLAAHSRPSSSSWSGHKDSDLPSASVRESLTMLRRRSSNGGLPHFIEG